ncbi:hypothetical protein U1Q18_011052 [Sarracenia purpurea var. burkii]
MTTEDAKRSRRWKRPREEASMEEKSQSPDKEKRPVDGRGQEKSRRWKRPREESSMDEGQCRVTSMEEKS